MKDQYIIINSLMEYARMLMPTAVLDYTAQSRYGNVIDLIDLPDRADLEQVIEIAKRYRKDHPDRRVEIYENKPRGKMVWSVGS